MVTLDREIALHSSDIVMAGEVVSPAEILVFSHGK